MAPIVLLDRCMLDLYAYARLVQPGNTYLLGMAAELTVCSLSCISAIFYTPITAELSECRSLNENASFRLAIDKEIPAAAQFLDVEICHVVGNRGVSASYCNGGDRAVRY